MVARPVIGRRCHELRIRDRDQTWRIVYRTDPDAIVIADVFSKETAKTPKTVLDACTSKLQMYDQLREGKRR